MNLDEVFAKTATRPSAFICGLIDDGYGIINNKMNTYATCLVKPDADEVVIVNIDPHCARHFYQYCFDNPENPLLPRIHEIRDFNGGYMARMERLIALDHIDLDKRHGEVLDMLASTFVSYIRAEADDMTMASMEAACAPLRDTARDLLAISQHVYKNSNGTVLPVCDLKPDNVFLRITDSGEEFVFGDPLLPVDPRNPDNPLLMENAYRRFGLPALKDTLTAAPKAALHML